MNRFCTIFLMVLSTSFAEPPSSTYGAPSLTYGAPSRPSGWETVSSGWETVSPGWESISSGYDYQPSVSKTIYSKGSVGHISSEGAYVDADLLAKVKKVILAHEQSSGSSSVSISRPSSSYGVPKPVYGPPSGWQQTGWVQRVTDLQFDHPVQSYPAAYYIGYDTYAPASKGWAPASKGWAPSNGWKETVVVTKPKSTYGVPSQW